MATSALTPPPAAGMDTRVRWGRWFAQRPDYLRKMMTADYWNAPTEVGAHVQGGEGRSVVREVPTEIAMERLHPDDQAELAATAEMLQKAEDMEAGYKAAALCLARAAPAYLRFAGGSRP